MGVSLKSHWLVYLAVLLLVGCGNKKENGGAAHPASPSVKAATMPATAPTGVTKAPRKVVILPEVPTAKDTLLAVFSGGTGLVTYRWEKNGELLAGEERDRLAPANLAKGATITVNADNNGVSSSASVTIGNLPPTVQQVTFKNPAIHRGVDIELDAIGKDVDGDDVTFLYKWFCNGTQLELVDGPKLTGDQFSRGDLVSFIVTPFDGTVEGVPYEGKAITIPDAPPRFVTTPPLQFSSATYRYQARAEDPDGDEVTYALDSPPPKMTIDSKTGQINWDLTELPAGLYRINIVADDGQGQKGYQEYSLTMSRQ